MVSLPNKCLLNLLYVLFEKTDVRCDPYTMSRLMACEEQKRIFSSLSQENTGCCCRLQNKPYLPSGHSEHPPRPEFPAASNFPVWQTVCQIQNLAFVLTCNVSGGPTEAHLRESHLYIISITNYKD